jgi:fumarylpyruvate hydrolase
MSAIVSSRDPQAYAVAVPILPSVEIAGSPLRFPVHRIYCVGRNYAEHAVEMGSDPQREAPCFFSKPADAVAPPGAQLHYPPETRNYHHEVELVVAIGKPAFRIAAESALEVVYGYAVGLDMTRRDLQAAAKSAGQPWDMSKGFDESAPCSAIHPSSTIGHPRQGRIQLRVNGKLRQDADIGSMIWSVPELVARLSAYVRLQPGDLIFTGTPAGVGPLQIGDQVEAGVTGIDTLRVSIID